MVRHNDQTMTESDSSTESGGSAPADHAPSDEGDRARPGWFDRKSVNDTGWSPQW